MVEIRWDIYNTEGLLLCHCLAGIVDIVGITDDPDVGRGIHLPCQSAAQGRMTFIHNYHGHIPHRLIVVYPRI